MALSGTANFSLNVTEVIQEAYDRIGGDPILGYDVRSARRSLNILFSEWGNRGVHLWKVKLYDQTLTTGLATYTTPSDCSDVLEAYVSTSGGTPGESTSDLSLTKIDRSAYAALPNKLSQGTPSQYYVQRTYSPSIFLYQTPGTQFSSSSTPSNYQLRFYYLARIEDAGKYTNTPDVVFRFLPCLTSGLSYYLSITYKPEKTEMLKLVYEDEMQRALTQDSQAASLFISPKTFYGDGV